MASVVAETVTRAPIVVHRAWWRGRLVQVAGIVALMYVAYRARALEYPWPNDLVWNQLSFHLDDFQTWLLTERGKEDQSIVFTVFEGFSSGIDHLVEWFNRLLIWLTWAGTTVAGVAVVWRFGGLRAALITLSAFATFALFGLWEESMETLALMLASVGLSLLVGIPLGILAGRSARFRRAITPILDAMQIVPAFAYLMPVVILFSIGPAAAVVSTMIYAIPPAIRITALGIRGVPVNTVEAATSMGATRMQLLGKVQLPLARRMILLGVSQTILFALSMVVIAGLIGGGGLGAVVTSGLYSNPALAILAGLVIVVMAMALDRSFEAIARADRSGGSAPRRGEEATSDACAGRGDRGRSRSLESLRHRRRLPGRGRELAAHGDDRGVAAGQDPGRARLRAGPDHLGLRDHRARRHLHPPAAPAPAAAVPGRGALVHDRRSG